MAAADPQPAGTAVGRAQDLAGFLAGTDRRAFSLALRITGERALAEEAAEAAYGRLKEPYSEAALFEAVRAEALRLAPRSGEAAQSYVQATVIRAAFESLGTLQRSALELAHSGGLGVQAIAEVLGEEPAVIRGALREALLTLGNLVKEGNAP